MTTPIGASTTTPSHLVVSRSQTPLNKLPTLAQLASQIDAAQSLNLFPSSQRFRLTSSLETSAFRNSCEADVRAGPTVFKGCAYGDVRSKELVVLYGDSEAAQWQPAFNLLGLNHHYKLILVSRAGCPVADLPKYLWPNCRRWKVNAMKYINSLKPNIVVLASHNADGPEAQGTITQFTAGLQSMLLKFTTPALSKIALEGMPHVNYDGNPATDDPLVCMKAHLKTLTSCATPVLDSLWTDREAADAATYSTSGVSIVSLTALFCITTCPQVVNNKIVYANADHTTSWYARYVANALAEIVKPYGL